MLFRWSAAVSQERSRGQPPQLRLRSGVQGQDVKTKCGSSSMVRSGRTSGSMPSETLAIWHQETPHKWPLQVVMDTWEELHWRFLEEIKELVRQIKKQAKRESLTLQELRFYALLPGPDGTAWLTLPRTFDLMNPEGWFKTELEPRIERKQERTLWRLTWDGGKAWKGSPGRRSVWGQRQGAW